MSLFEFQMVLLSIIVGLGVSELVAVLAWRRERTLHRVLAPLMPIGLVLDTGLVNYRID